MSRRPADWADLFLLSAATLFAAAARSACSSVATAWCRCRCLQEAHEHGRTNRGYALGYEIKRFMTAAAATVAAACL
jgi:hypothetical protein